ncbi:MAG TPA: VOC family protein [Acidimicrobiia bacterium]|nr:VOC family protein [Acidimicrobiia bacterium]
MISRLQVATVFVSDLERAIEFFVDALGFDIVADWRGDDGDRMVFTLPPGAETEIGLYAPGPDDPRIGISSGLVFTAEDIRATVSELKARGVEFTRDIVMHDYGDGDRPGDTGDLDAEFVDRDGNRFLLHS